FTGESFWCFHERYHDFFNDFFRPRIFQVAIMNGMCSLRGQWFAAWRPKDAVRYANRFRAAQTDNGNGPFAAWCGYRGDCIEFHDVFLLIRKAQASVYLRQALEALLVMAFFAIVSKAEATR